MGNILILYSLGREAEIVISERGSPCQYPYENMRMSGWQECNSLASKLGFPWGISHDADDTSRGCYQHLANDGIGNYLKVFYNDNDAGNTILHYVIFCLESGLSEWGT